MHKANVTMLASKETPLNWHTIRWINVNKQVNQLRRRIYRASARSDLKKARNLQKLMIKSFSNKLIAIRRVTQVNQGKRTPGVDKVVVSTAKERSWLLDQLDMTHMTKVKPIKRAYIPKKNGKERPLGLPTILDRCRQAMVKSALEPYWEAKFEATSYGFRPGRSAHDAIKRVHCSLRTGTSRPWILDADIEGAFDHINHDYLMKTIGASPARKWIKAWLESEIIEDKQKIPTIAGTPQGGVISPLLANIALHGMEEELDITYNSRGHIKTTSRYALVRYADDFVIFSKTKAECEKAKESITKWLSIRGLKLSEEKTKIVHIEQGFDFLGFNIRQYRTNRKRKKKVLLCKPSKASVRSFKKQMKDEWKKTLMWDTKRVIENLNPKIKGWCNYFRVGTSKETFKKLDGWMWKRQMRFARRRHPNKHWWWCKKRYWGKIKGWNDKWVFVDTYSHKELFLWKLAWTPIKRHILVKGRSSPDDPTLRIYWQQRQANHSKYLFKLRSILWRKQKGKCLVCYDNIDNGEPIHIHHLKPKKMGGSESLKNLAMIHAECHRQVHSKKGSTIAEVRKLLEPYAG